MATIRPFRAIRYSTVATRDLSDLVAPPYDVLDAQKKAALQAKSPFNIVSVDLPFVPPKQLGPAEVYAKAAETMRQWMSSGLLVRDQRAAIYPFEQSFDHRGRTIRRRGFFALVKLTPFGVDVMPHEQTYPGPIEDRLHLMRATDAQLSPVFGLFFDGTNEITETIFNNVHRPDATATLEGTKCDLWSIFDAAVEEKILMMMEDKKVYIADGHHRYTTALHFQRDAEQKAGGRLPDTHPANYALFALVCADDPGLLVLPTHRILGGCDSFDLDAFCKAISPHFEIQKTPLRPDHVDEFALMLEHESPNTIGLYDAKSKALLTLKLTDGGLMKQLEPGKSDAWRSLDVAIVQRYLIDEVLAKKFSPTGQVSRAYTADENQIVPLVESTGSQLALILKPTPTRALRDLGETGEVMPPKSTYFYPKLPTGLVIAPLG